MCYPPFFSCFSLSFFFFYKKIKKSKSATSSSVATVQLKLPQNAQNHPEVLVLYNFGFEDPIKPINLLVSWIHFNRTARAAPHYKKVFFWHIFTRKCACARRNKQINKYLNNQNRYQTLRLRVHTRGNPSKNNHFLAQFLASILMYGLTVVVLQQLVPPSFHVHFTDKATWSPFRIPKRPQYWPQYSHNNSIPVKWRTLAWQNLPHFPFSAGLNNLREGFKSGVNTERGFKLTQNLPCPHHLSPRHEDRIEEHIRAKTLTP